MLEKTVLSEKDVRVTFKMPPLDGVVELYLSGDFNNWHTAGAPLSQEPDGSWVVTLVLKAGKSYRFRYLDNQGRWHNDWDADAYVPNDFGTEDSVVDLVASLKKIPQAHPKASEKGAAAKGTTSGTGAAKGTTARNSGGTGKPASGGLGKSASGGKRSVPGKPASGSPAKPASGGKRSVPGKRALFDKRTGPGQASPAGKKATAKKREHRSP